MVSGNLDNDRWMLFFRENFFPQFSAFQTDAAGKLVVITEQVESSGFDSRPVAYPFLIVPVDLKAGESTDIYVRYKSGGSSEVRFTIETDKGFTEISNNAFFKNSIFYGMLFLLFMVSAAVFLYSWRKVFFAYAASTLISLLLIMHLDGTAFQFVWPGLPQFNGNASLYLGLFSLFFGAMFAREFLQTKRYHGFVDKVLLAIMISTMLLFVGTGFLDSQVLKWGLVLLAPFTYLWFLISGLVAARKRFKEVRFYVIAWSGVFISSLGLMAREILGIELSEELQWDSMRVVMVADAAFMGLGMLDRYNQLRVASQESMRASLRQARQNLQLTQRLNDLEKQYAVASELASTKDQEMMNTVHDLRQPLHALRLKVHGMMQGNEGEEQGAEDITQTFSYLENLISSQLGAAAAHSNIVDGAADIRDESEDDSNRHDLSTDAILSSVHEMFSNDAKEKDIELHYEPSSHEAAVDSLVLMRIVSNLVSNAIKYTDAGSVKFGMKRQGDRLLLAVEDTGIGMSESQFKAALEHNVRLGEGAKRAEGNGYGLAIVEELAEEHGLTVSLSEKQRSGTAIQVDFPLKAA